MKKALLFLTLILIGIGCVSADEGGYTIDTYTVDITLNTNGSMHVIENIEANFSEPRHGIYREIPVYANGRNFLIENFSASNDPVAANTIENGNYSLKIGSADETILGKHTYTISYDVQNPITSFETDGIIHQELYRNIIGNQRNTSINNISFSIRLPQSHTFGSGELFALYGPEGATNTNGLSIKQTSYTTIKGNMKNNILNANEGLTIGMNFGSGYFMLPTNYEELSEQIPTDSSGFDRIFALIPLLFSIGFFSIVIKVFKAAGSKKKGYRSNKKATTIYYTPPKNIEISEAFWFRYMRSDPKIFSALIYYRATKGWIRIENIHKKQFFGLFKTNSYNLIETGTKPKGATAFDDVVFQSFFGVYDNTLDTIAINNTTYKKVTAIFSTIQERFNKNNLTEKSGLFGLVMKLTPAGENVFEQMRGYKEFLEKVERPVIESELKNDPDYINKLLPWAVLFGLETKLLNRIEDLLQVAAKNRYTSNDGMGLTTASLMMMNRSIQTNSVQPSSSSSGFSGGSSGGGGGGGGGGSR